MYQPVVLGSCQASLPENIHRLSDQFFQRLPCALGYGHRHSCCIHTQTQNFPGSHLPSQRQLPLTRKHILSLELPSLNVHMSVIMCMHVHKQVCTHSPLLFRHMEIPPLPPNAKELPHKSGMLIFPCVCTQGLYPSWSPQSWHRVVCGWFALASTRCPLAEEDRKVLSTWFVAHPLSLRFFEGF